MAREKYSRSVLISDLNKEDRDQLLGELRCDGSIKQYMRKASRDIKYFLTML